MKIKDIFESENTILGLCNESNRFYFVIIALLIIFAYLPTIQHDYVTGDQWRAFKYSVFDESPIVKASKCFNSRIQQDLRVGRPFGSIGEYIEHAWVSKISDFSTTRPMGLILVILTAFFVGKVLSSSVGGIVNGTAIGALFVFSPGYAFIYYVGLTVIMTLIALILATLSYIFIRQAIKENINKKKLLLSSVLFLVACMIYPAWAFVVFIFSLIDFLFGKETEQKNKIKHLLKTVLFFTIISIIYYLIIKIIIILLPSDNLHAYYLTGYDFSANFSPLYLGKRFLLAILFYLSQPPLNTLHLSLKILNIIFLLSVIVICSILFFKNNKDKLIRIIYLFLLTTLLSFILIFISIAPWLVSEMAAPGNRIFITFPLFICALIGWTIYSVSNRFFPTKKYISTILIVFAILLPASVIQNKRSAIEVGISGTEIESMRLIVHKWIDEYSFTKQRCVVVVRPKRPRPLLYDNILNNVRHGAGAFQTPDDPLYYFNMVSELFKERGDQDHILVRLGRVVNFAGYGENLEFAYNPVYYKKMFVALIREKCDRHHPFALMKIYIADFINDDVDNILDSSPYNIVFTVVNQGDKLKIKHDILEINFSLITNLPEPLIVERQKNEIQS
jgi:hypothetical protein